MKTVRSKEELVEALEDSKPEDSVIFYDGENNEYERSAVEFKDAMGMYDSFFDKYKAKARAHGKRSAFATKAHRFARKEYSDKYGSFLAFNLVWGGAVAFAALQDSVFWTVWNLVTPAVGMWLIFNFRNADEPNW